MATDNYIEMKFENTDTKIASIQNTINQIIGIVELLRDFRFPNTAEGMATLQGKSLLQVAKEAEKAKLEALQKETEALAKVIKEAADAGNSVALDFHNKVFVKGS